MPGVPRELAEHSLDVSKTAKPVKQKLRRFAKHRKEVIRIEVLKVPDQDKTAFITPHDIYCYTTMTFGLKNAERPTRRPSRNV
jgi:Zn-finger domain-containing protein